MSSHQKALDVLAVAPHPDDAELFCGGTLAKLAALGYRVGVLDLTRGEKASRGSPELRAQEAAQASEVLGLAWRGNLGLPDCALAAEDVAQQQALTAELRRLRPEIVLAPWREDRHPDHRAASLLAKNACFLAGLVHWPSADQPVHRVRQILYYPLRTPVRPSFVVDIAAFAEQKARAIACHHSQVGPAAVAVGTLVGATLALPALAHRDGYWGAQVGCAAAEAFVCEEVVPVADPVALFRARAAAPQFTGEAP